MFHRITFESSAALMSNHGISKFHKRLLTLSLCSLSSITDDVFRLCTLTMLSKLPVASRWSNVGCHYNESSRAGLPLIVDVRVDVSTETMCTLPLKQPTASSFCFCGLNCRHRIESEVATGFKDVNEPGL